MADWQTRHIDESDFLVVDVETTGLSPDTGDRVCEIGAIKIRGGAVVDTLSSLINPCRPISAGAYAVNRISPAMVAGAPEFHQIAERLLQMIEGSVLVAYNAPFDVRFSTANSASPAIRASARRLSTRWRSRVSFFRESADTPRRTLPDSWESRFL